MARSRSHDTAARRRTETTSIRVDQLAALFTSLEISLSSGGCDNTLALTERWLTAHHCDVEREVAWLQAHGGYCDCEVLFNVAPKVSSMSGREN